MIVISDSVYAKASRAARPQRQNTPVRAAPPHPREDRQLRAGRRPRAHTGLSALGFRLEAGDYRVDGISSPVPVSM